ncbi:transketolase family protein [bacterium]|nr:transketolase family protein [bacterium]
MEIEKTNKGSIRKTFGNTLAKIGEQNTQIVVLDADLACSTQTKIFQDKFPNRFFDCGIAEQDMIATAAGLASEGKIPFAASFSVFATGRVYDQIRNGVCYPKFNVKIIGTHGGITVGEDGATHQALEDISLMRSLPNMTVIVPADCRECEEVIKYAASYNGPVYVRISRSNVVNIFDDTYRFNPDKAVIVEDGEDITIFSNGETLVEAILASKELKQLGICARVVNVPVVKPLDTSTIVECSKKSKFVVTVENHSIIGGLGSAICETLSEKYPIKVLRIGVNDEFGQSGTSDELMHYYGLDSKSLTKKIKEFYDKEIQ